MMALRILILACLILSNFAFSQVENPKEILEKGKITQVLDDLNQYASEANFQKYFELYDDESIFIGTDATEIWNKREFMAYAKPHFDKGKAWSFKTMKRNIYFSKDKKYAWFDELLKTQMKICRGSGVLVKKGKDWKIKQYVLSMTIPNDVSNEVIKIKTPIEDPLILELMNQTKKSD